MIICAQNNRFRVGLPTCYSNNIFFPCCRKRDRMPRQFQDVGESLLFSLFRFLFEREGDTSANTSTREGKEINDGLVAALCDFQMIPPKVTLVI